MLNLKDLFTKKYSSIDQMNDRKRARYKFFIEEINQSTNENVYDFGSGSCILKEHISAKYFPLDLYPVYSDVVKFDMDDLGCWNSLEVKPNSTAVFIGSLEYCRNPFLTVSQLAEKKFSKILISFSTFKEDPEIFLPKLTNEEIAKFGIFFSEQIGKTWFQKDKFWFQLFERYFKIEKVIDFNQTNLSESKKVPHEFINYYLLVLSQK